MGDNPMTEEGFKALQAKLDRLRTEVMPQLEQQLGEAREKGDLSENAEYDAAREKIWETEQKMAELELQLQSSFAARLPDEPSDTVAFGYLMDVRKLPDGKTETFQLVGVGEADFTNGRVSFLSPFAQAFINHKVGETVKVEVPAGTSEYEIEAVRVP